MAQNKMKISDIKANPNNPRIIKDDKFKGLVQSVRDFPEMLELRPIVVNKDMIILGGNMRYKACKEAWLKEIPVIVADNLTEEQEREFLIKDNVSGGEWDWDILANEWNSEELAEWGLDVQFETVEPTAEEDDFEVDEWIKTDIVLWDLFEIGEHRLLCWDSTNIDDVNKLMNGEKADISFTSPPYNAWTTPTEVKMWKKSKYANDSDNKSEDEYLKLLIDFTNNSLTHSEYSFVNIQSLSWNKIALIDFLYNMKDVYADTIIWQKQNAQPAMAENVLNSQYEYIHIFSYKANRAIWTKRFRWTLSNVLEISKQTKNEVKEHNATFPMEFVSHFISNFCEKSVLDLFGWSWTTMVACHQLKRKCFMSELDPKYVQTIINRMMKLDSTLEIKRNWVPYTNSDFTDK